MGDENTENNGRGATGLGMVAAIVGTVLAWLLLRNKRHADPEMMAGLGTYLGILAGGVGAGLIFTIIGKQKKHGGGERLWTTGDVLAPYIDAFVVAFIVAIVDLVLLPLISGS